MQTEHKRKIGLANSPLMKEKWKDPEYRKRMVKAHKDNPTKYWLGKKRSEETKEKLSKANKGKHFSTKTEFKKGNKPVFTWKGKKQSKETRLKRSKSLPKGKNHHNWKGGISSENEIVRHSIEFSLWREAVFARDNWTCQKCGIKGGKLHPHHIQNFAEYKELRFAIDNGVTLSEKAHREFHKVYGRKNNTKEQLEEFLRGTYND